MTDALLIISALCAAAAALTGIVLVLSRPGKELLRLETLLETLIKNQERAEAALGERLSQGRIEAGQQAQLARQELTAALQSFSQSLLSRMTEIATLQKQQLDTFSNQLSLLTRTNEEKIEAMRQTVEKNIQHLQQDNSQKLEQMRQTVDEKLHATLERRLG